MKEPKKFAIIEKIAKKKERRHLEKHKTKPENNRSYGEKRAIA
jgi:hypothetical protein